ncbi:MAG: cytochrome c oxidase accessory protein CcoG [Burkholderiales bacterium]|nr:cytochrome c oxidase accessory protein CcoG [Burkholderiales bacterium]MDE2076607.1 cytochrome c oxidase accessory protein CcoG [Burkholderiales bacterium]MDE2432179.1 cytochrome c oxidase accessory protein CcoG [Burkholderiales bacterium]
MSESTSSQDATSRVIPIQPDPNAAATHEELVSLYKKSEKLYPREVAGWFVKWRWVIVWFTQIIFYGLPWLTWGDRQAVLFDLGGRRFYLFKLVLYPQDFIYLTGLLIISAYSLFLFTAVAGRLWCGYACPQTVYTEIFMWIERRFEGDRVKRMKLDKSAFSFGKLWRKAGKHASWLALALWTGFTFVGYFTPIRVLASEVVSFGLGPWETFWVLFYGFATYGNAGYMREQVCKYMCPYARFQSAMFDRDTLIVSYDTKRGEPRGSRSRKADPKALGLGDCIDCTLCVQVCPTGIDIRKGLQYECIGCAACIDVCDSVMDKVGSPRGLIRYATLNALDKGWGGKKMWQRIARPRVLIYTGILVVVMGAFMFSLLTRTPFRVDIVRDRGALARIVDDGFVENVYQVQLMNASELPQRYRVGVEQLPQAVLNGGEDIVLAPAEARWVPVAVRVPPEVAARLGTGAHSMTMLIEQLRQGDEPQIDLRERTTFMVPR